jgi:hypothetical protein
MRNKVLQALLLTLILKCGEEYRITDSNGAVFYYLVEEALPNGDYVAYSTFRWLGLKGWGRNVRPSFEYKKDPRWRVVLKSSKILEAELISPSLIRRAPEDAK